MPFKTSEKDTGLPINSAVDEDERTCAHLSLKLAAQPLIAAAHLCMYTNGNSSSENTPVASTF